VLSGRIDGLGIPMGYTSLASHLRQAGYTTGGFVDNGWVSRDYGYQQGFDEFFSVNETMQSQPFVERIGTRISDLFGDSVSKRILRPLYHLWRQKQGEEGGYTPAHTDADTVDKAIEWVSEQSDPYFLWVHFMNAHTPYGYWPDHLKSIRGDANIEHTIHPGEEGLVEEGRDPPRRVLDTYDAGVRFVDAQIGRLLKHIADGNKVVVTGDHGEEFGTYNDFHEASLYSSMTNVPLVCKNFDISDEREGDIAQHIDIPTTILYSTGRDIPDHWDGQPLQETTSSDNEPVFYSLEKDRVGVQLGQWKLLREGNSIRLLKCTDNFDEEVRLENGPGEELNVLLDKFWDSRDSIGNGRSEAEMSKRTEANLEELGYL
jgi:arylsulfatase A-like enzyme